MILKTLRKLGTEEDFLHLIHSMDKDPQVMLHSRANSCLLS